LENFVKITQGKIKICFKNKLLCYYKLQVKSEYLSFRMRVRPVTRQLFVLAQTAWRNENRKWILSEEEVIVIDQQFFQLERMVNLNLTSDDYLSFMLNLNRLIRLIRDAEIKMGYVPIQIYLRYFIFFLLD
jgi:hypothetical protein